MSDAVDLQSHDASVLMLPRRSIRQPSPAIHQPGDCGACSLGGALGMDVPDIYSAFASDGITNMYEMGRCLRCAELQGRADRIIDTSPTWNYWSTHPFGNPGHFVYLQWFAYIRMAIEAGYYGLAMVDFHGKGGPETNHWVLICGAKTPERKTGETITGYILTSCSVRGEAWHDVRDFLRLWGGYNALLIRPART